MSLANDLRTYLVEMEGLAQLHVDLAQGNMVPSVKWKKVVVWSKRLRKRVESSIERKGA